MLVSLDDITIRLNDRTAFSSTTWQIEQGQRWAVLGPSGSGKTVLAKTLAHRQPLLHGQIIYYFDGPDRPGRPYLYPNEILTFSGETHRAFLARFATYHQARWQSFEGESVPTVAGLLELNGSKSRSPFEIVPTETGVSLRTEVDRLIDLFGLAPLLTRQVHQLSHGESRKVFLTRLLLRTPKLLILDDPFTGLDQATRARLQSGIEALLTRPDLSILFISARPEELPDSISHLLVVEKLRVAAQGQREQVARQAALPHPTPDTPANEDSSTEFASAGLLSRYADTLAPNAGAGQKDLVRMAGVSVAYHNVHVLENVDWTVRSGERWALLGPNGAGKTTLLSLILADNPQAYRNDVYLFGQKRGSGESIWEIKHKIGWVSPELHAFYDRSATTQEVVLSGFFDSVGLHQHSTQDQREQAAGWLRALGLAGSLIQPFTSLSAGQQRLVLLARALVKQPPLLVLDEPCQGLDEIQRDRFLGFIEQLCAQTRVTMIYITHDPSELPTAITHQLRLSQGKVVFSGPVPRLNPLIGRG